MADMAELAQLIDALKKINQDNIAEIIRHLGMIADSARGKEYAQQIRKQGAAVLKLAGTMEFKPAYKRLLESVDEVLFDVKEEARDRYRALQELESEANAALCRCAKSAGIAGYKYDVLVIAPAAVNREESRVQ